MPAKKNDTAPEVLHAVRRPGGLVAEYIKGADGVTRREVRKLTAAELEAETPTGEKA